MRNLKKYLFIALFGAIGFSYSNFSIANTFVCQEYKQPVSGKSAKEKATDVPSWVKGHKPCKKPNESGTAFAHRLMKTKYPNGSYSTGPNSEFNKIKKFADRAFQ